MEQTFRFIYRFNARHVDGNGGMKDILGGKGAGLAEMSRIGLPVPPGFTISTEACSLFLNSPGTFEKLVWPEVTAALRELEEVSARQLGCMSEPLLLSVRSGARFSMPGMMDTVLDIGLNDEIAESVARAQENRPFAFDSYRRFLQMFGDVVLEIPEHEFESALAARLQAGGARSEADLTGEDLTLLCRDFKAIIHKGGKTVPAEPEDQLRLAIEAVFRSWNNPRARAYRRLNDISEDLGTAVNVQMMVFGNRNTRSGSGVGFTRNPATGEARLYGEFLPQAQGEEVVAGTRTPLSLSELKRWFPGIDTQLEAIAGRLEKRYREMQDFEFTIENNKLYLLQTRDGKRTGPAAVRMAVDMEREGLISREEALLRVEPGHLDQLLYPVFAPTGAEVLAVGLPASPGAAVGAIVFSSEAAVEWARRGSAVILVRAETTPDDIQGMQAAEGILTARGGMTSHAAVVARGMGRCCVVGCESLKVDEEKKELQAAGRVLKEGDSISIDGSDGRVLLGTVEKVDAPTGQGLFSDFMALMSGIPVLSVRANADTVRDAVTARAFGASGIGLCRTEHMFFDADRLPVMQEMIMAKGSGERQRPLARLKEFQKADFLSILEAMDGLPVTVRLLDPPLHEFLPRREALVEEIQQLRNRSGSETEAAAREAVLRRVDELHESNPMMGHRGCRLGIAYPEITRAQTEALFEAACELKRRGKSPEVEVMIPLVASVQEFRDQASVVRQAAETVFVHQEIRVSYSLGTMIETPRAALLADEIAREAEFFSFGTNDLTQMTFGFSRDDSGGFIGIYLEKHILPKDPFQVLDQAGVGQLMRMAVEKGRKARPSIQLGICGEHGGEPASVEFCAGLGLDYVSCSPYRVPGARLAAAQATLRHRTMAQQERVGV